MLLSDISSKLKIRFFCPEYLQSAQPVPLPRTQQHIDFLGPFDGFWRWGVCGGRSERTTFRYYSATASVCTLFGAATEVLRSSGFPPGLRSIRLLNPSRPVDLQRSTQGIANSVPGRGLGPPVPLPASSPPPSPATHTYGETLILRPSVDWKGPFQAVLQRLL